MFFHRKRTWMGLVISTTVLAVSCIYLVFANNALFANKNYTDTIYKTLNQYEEQLRLYQQQKLPTQFITVQAQHEKLINDIGLGELTTSSPVQNYKASIELLFDSIQSSEKATRRQGFQQIFSQLNKIRAHTSATLSDGISQVRFLSIITLLCFLCSVGFFWYANISLNGSYKSRVMRLIRRQRARHKNSISQRAAQVSATQRLFDGLNHHLRTPISTSIGLLEMLRNSSLTKEQKDLIDKVNTASFQVLQQIDTLVGLFEKDIFSDTTTSVQVFNINALIDESLKEFALQADSQGQYINIDDAIKPGTLIRADFIRLKIALMGTVHKALQQAQTSAIKIHATIKEEQNAHCVFCVMLSFMPRSSESGTNKPIINSNSILSALNFDSNTLQQLYDKAGVTVSDERTITGLAQLQFEVPIEKVSADNNRDKNIFNRLNGNYAVVDDLASSRNLLSYYIEQSNGAARCFTTGNELLTALKNNETFDAIILDFHMPSISGLETLELINALYKDNQIPIVMISADPGLKSEPLNKYPAVESVLIKPIKRRELVDVLWSMQSKVQFKLPNSRLKILLVEDDPISAEIMINILNNLRYKVVHVMSGAEAESATLSKNFDVVLVDIRLPDTNGHALVKKIKQQSTENNGMIFIAITAHNAQDYADISDSIGINYHLTKPVTAEDLKRALSVAVASS